VSAEQVHFSSVADAAEREGFPVTARARVRPPRRRGDGWLWFAVAVITLVVLGIAGGITSFYRSYEGRIYPNVSIQGIAVGEMTPNRPSLRCARAMQRSSVNRWSLRMVTVSGRRRLTSWA
jgi:hypothetical protein